MGSLTADGEILRIMDRDIAAILKGPDHTFAGGKYRTIDKPVAALGVALFAMALSREVNRKEYEDMGMADVKAAFETGLAGKASCTRARMDYQSDKTQLFTFDVVPNGSTATTVTMTVAPGHDPNTLAKITGAEYAGGLS